MGFMTRYEAKRIANDLISWQWPGLGLSCRVLKAHGFFQVKFADFDRSMGRIKPDLREEGIHTHSLSTNLFKQSIFEAGLMGGPNGFIFKF